MHRLFLVGMLLVVSPVLARAEEIFVTIRKVSGNQLEVVKSAGGGRGVGMRGNAASGQPIMIAVPAKVKITSAMRERRTSEFRVGVELPGGLRNKVFQNIGSGLQARIVTDGTKVTEINVITSETDINQSNVNVADGQTVIAVRPKRPPMKKSN